MLWSARVPLSPSPGLIYAGVLAAAAFEPTANKFSLLYADLRKAVKQVAMGSTSPILLQYRTHTFKPDGVKWNKLGHKPRNTMNAKWEGTPKVLSENWCGTKDQTRRWALWHVSGLGSLPS